MIGDCSMNNKYSKVYVLCPPHVKTGGTELLHQLVHRINSLGGNAFIVYQAKSKEDAHVSKAFSIYIDNFLLPEQIDDNENNLLVIPEIYCYLLNRFCHIKKAVWWLSVDNFLLFDGGFKGRIRQRGFLKGILGALHGLTKQEFHNSYRLLHKADMHLCQSYYAIDFLAKLGITKNIYYLSDYINDVYIENSSKIDLNRKEDIVLYNPKKGFEFTRKLIEQGKDIHWVAIQGMTTEEVQDLMRRSKVYIDFGNHPGKDRIPREAAMSFCCVITGKRGSAAFSEDVPIPAEYKFDDDDKHIDNIIELIHSCVGDYDSRIKEFADYRNTILEEKEKFTDDIKTIFFTE
jgi:hypothetical protein